MSFFQKVIKNLKELIFQLTLLNTKTFCFLKSNKTQNEKNLK